MIQEKNYDSYFSNFNGSYNFAYDIIMNADLSNTKYLYYYGEYISENEKKIAEYLAKFSDEEVQAMADTYTEGYIRGFVTMGADLSIKSTVLLRYPIGFERMMRCAVKNFEKIGKKVTISRAPQDVITKFPGRRPGYNATQANPQFDYDHRYDCALFMDNRFKEHKLDCQKNTWEKVKEEMGEYQAELDAMAAASDDQERAAAYDRAEDELGDFLFATVNAARLYGLNPDTALERTCAKFRRRFTYLEEQTIRKGRNLTDMTLAEMDAIWDEGKAKGL